MVQIIKRPLFFFEVHLPASTKRAISVRRGIFFDEEAACSIAFVGDGNGGGHACDASANDNDVVFAIPFLARRACAAAVSRCAPHDAERGCASEGDARTFDEVATRGRHSVGHFVVSHDSSLSMSDPTEFVLSKKPFSDFSRSVRIAFIGLIFVSPKWVISHKTRVKASFRSVFDRLNVSCLREPDYNVERGQIAIMRVDL